MKLIRKTASQGYLKDFLELFKGFYCSANGTTHWGSSNSSWAEVDLEAEMSATASNPPLFLEAIYDACEAVRSRPGDLFASDSEMINSVCRNHIIPYEIRRTELILRDTAAEMVTVADYSPTLAEQAHEILQNSMRRAEELLSSEHERLFRTEKT